MNRVALALWMGFASVVVWATGARSAHGQVVDDKTLSRLLISRKELTRLRGVAIIQSHPRLKYDHLDAIVDAAEHQVEKLDEDDSPSPSLVAMLTIIGSTTRPSAGEFLGDQLASANDDLAMLVADILGAHQYRETIEAIGTLFDRPGFKESYAYRFNAVRALWAMKDPAAIEILAQWMPSLDGQLRADLERMFSKLDVGHFGGDEEALAEWKDEQAEKPVFKNVAYSVGEREKPVFAKSEYYGIPIEAKRLLFILDHSGSMKKADGGYTRLDRARKELVSAIAGLDSETEFAILIFSNKTRFWKSELMRADDDTKHAAIAFVNRIGYGDKTNTYSALLASLTFDSSLEAVYLLSDGAPTLGAIVSPPQIIADVIHRNRFRHLRFHTIGVAVTPTTRAFLETLASQSNAEFREVN